MEHNKNFKSMAIGMFLVVATFAYAMLTQSVSDFSFSNVVLLTLATASVFFLGKAIKNEQDHDSDRLGQL